MKYLYLFLTLLLGSCASVNGPQSFELREGIFYAGDTEAHHSADLYLTQTKNSPAVILVHGGGWSSRTRTDMNSIARSLARNGFTVMNISYRFAPVHRHPAPIEDLRLAHNYLISHAEKLGIDPSRIGLWGYSSGGHTVSFYALSSSPVREHKISAVVAGGAPYDFTWYPHSPIINDYMGGFRDQMLSEYIKASASSLVTPQAPPFFLYHGKKDNLVEFAQAAAFEAKLKAAGVKASLYEVGFWGHSLTFALPDGPVEEAIKFFKTAL